MTTMRSSFKRFPLEKSICLLRYCVDVEQLKDKGEDNNWIADTENLHSHSFYEEKHFSDVGMQTFEHIVLLPSKATSV